jgi:hypothetical protein
MDFDDCHRSGIVFLNPLSTPRSRDLEKPCQALQRTISKSGEDFAVVNG